MLKFGQSYVDKGMEHYEGKYRRQRSNGSRKWLLLLISNSLHPLRLSNEFLETIGWPDFFGFPDGLSDERFSEGSVANSVERPWVKPARPGIRRQCRGSAG
jgi:hypothetical protein